MIGIKPLVENADRIIQLKIGAVYKVLCVGECSCITNHKVLSGVEQSGCIEDHDIDWWIKFEIIQCQGCDSISFRKAQTNSENLNFETLQHEVKESLFPKRGDGRQRKVLAMWDAPDALRNILNETNEAFENNLMVLAGIGMRAVLETICKDQGAEQRTLDKKIDDLLDQGKLTSDNAEFLHNVRVLGNSAAHDVKQQEHSQMLLAWDIIVNLIDNLYILPAKAKRVFPDDTVQ